ncbi:galactose mutarotase-like protein [Panus rudis PR-1116 ss-1]|nr:galactose mutarotase-like protein [Panus rudis PR-1116 ss-1]
MSDPAFTPVLLALPSLTPSLALEILPHGLTIHRFYVQADGRTHDLVIGPEDPKDHLNQKYTNTIVGRYANRLPVQPFTISRNSLTSSFTPRPNESPSVSLHGGPTGFDSAFFEPVLDLSSVQLFTEEEKNTVIAEKLNNGSGIVFRRVSEDGEAGYPGKLLVEVYVSLVEPRGNQVDRPELKLGSVVIVYRAKLLEPGKVTPINLTQHWGFNLDASLHDDISTSSTTASDPLTIKDHKLTIQSSHILALDSHGLSKGELLNVKGTEHAHGEKEAGRIGERFPGSGYDHFYLFDRQTPSQPTRIPESELTPSTNLLKDVVGSGDDLSSESGKSAESGKGGAVVELESAKSGLRLSFDTNQSGVQFYTNNLTDPSKGARKKIHGGSGVSGAGDGYGKGTAAFLEFHEPLAAWLHPSSTKNENDTLLASGEVYNNWVRADVWFRNGGVGPSA